MKFKILLLIPILFLFYSSKAQAYAGVLDIVIDPANVTQTTVSAGANVVTAGAGTVTAAMTTADKVRTFVLDPLARAAMRRVIQRVTESTVNWINSGFNGNPGYIQNPKQFFLDIGDDVASQFLSQAGVNQICSPFRASVRLALVKNYINSDENYSCSLSILRDNFDAFTQDFTQGGWQGWFEVTQNPQNNPFGSYIEARNRLSLQVGQEQNQYRNELDLSGGFLNFKRCPAGSEFVDPVSLQRVCGVEEETVTPGTAIEGQLSRALGSGIEQLQLAKNFDEILGALVTQLFTRVTGGDNNGLYGNGVSMVVPVAPQTDIPTITLLGGYTVSGINTLNIPTGTKFTEPGWIALDGVPSDPSSNDIINAEISSENVTVSGTVSTNKPGVYQLVYVVTSPTTGRQATTTRNVIVGSAINPNGQCLTDVFKTRASNWAQIFDSFTIVLGRVNEGDIMRRVTQMIVLGNSERNYLISQGRDEVVPDMESLLVKLDQFKERADNADEDSIEQIIQLQREREDMKGFVIKLLASYSCNVPPPTYSAPVVSPIEVPDPTSTHTCDPYTPNPSISCLNVDRNIVLNILNGYNADNAGITAAMPDIQAVYPQATLLYHPLRLDKIDFGNGLVVDVMVGAGAPGAYYAWMEECACNRNPAGSTGTGGGGGNTGGNGGVIGTGGGALTQVTLTTVIHGIGQVSDGTNTFRSGNATTTTFNRRYPVNRTLTLTATPGLGQSFRTWGGSCQSFGSSNTCTGPITTNVTVVADFTGAAPGSFVVDFSVSGRGSLTDGVDTLYSSSNATTTAIKSYPANSLQTIRATASSTSTFIGWGGACAVFGNQPTCTGNVTANGSVWAIFRP